MAKYVARLISYNTLNPNKFSSQKNSNNFLINKIIFKVYCFYNNVWLFKFILIELQSH